MHDVTLVYTEYNHRLEVWVLGKRAANTTADRQQYTNTSKVCDDTMSMADTYRDDLAAHAYRLTTSVRKVISICNTNMQLSIPS